MVTHSLPGEAANVPPPTGLLGYRQTDDARFGGLITFEVANGDWTQAAAVVDACRLAWIAPSLGGMEALIDQPLVMSYWNYSAAERAKFGITDNMIRLACGIENGADIIHELRPALAATKLEN